MGIVAGRIVINRGGEQPYKVVLQHEPPEASSEYVVATIKEGEAILRKMLPPPQAVQGRYPAVMMDC